MKKTLLILLFLATALFVDYLILIAFGWSASEMGAQDNFYCGFYCKFGVSLLILAIIGSILFTRKFLASTSNFD